MLKRSALGCRRFSDNQLPEFGVFGRGRGIRGKEKISPWGVKIMSHLDWGSA
jgi:hypothetical protein